MRFAPGILLAAAAAVALASAAVAFALTSIAAGRPSLDVAPTSAKITVHETSAGAQNACPTGSAVASVFSKFVCLRVGQKCTSSTSRSGYHWEQEYHHAGFHCHTGRLTRPRAARVFTRRVDVGGYHLAINCQGSGTPTVVLESGHLSLGGAWMLLQPKVARTTRVCSYDRAGLGFSDPRPGSLRRVVPVALVVKELHDLLEAAGISPPYVLGGWSIGGPLIRIYTMRYPGEVLGLVSVDSALTGFSRPYSLGPPPRGRGQFFISDEVAERAASFRLGARPHVVLMRGRETPPTPAEVTDFKRLARLSTSPILVRADKANHGIQLQAPRLTAEAFRLVIVAVRGRVPLPACKTTALPRLGGTCIDPTSP
jgi:pimeloyl-ACP methyl ester carboxylesterase